MLFLSLLPMLWDVFEKVGVPIASNLLPEATKAVTALTSSSRTASGILGAIEGVVGRFEDEKRLQLNAELQSLLSQIQLDSDEILSSKPWYMIPHAIAEMAADIYIATGFVICTLHMVLWMFDLNVPFSGYDNITVGIALSFSGLLKTYKALTK